jgi:hypothetical protein
MVWKSIRLFFLGLFVTVQAQAVIPNGYYDFTVYPH